MATQTTEQFIEATLATIDTAQTTLAVEATKEKPRVFIYNGAELEDPDPAMKEDGVKELYQQVYPELTTATCVISFEKRDGVDAKVVTFKKAAGTKG